MDSDLMRWVKAQVDDPNANPRFRELLTALEAARVEVERVNSWNASVSVCRDHVADIVDGPCVICALDAAEARADKLTEALREAQPFIGWAGSYPELHAKIDALLRGQEKGND